jgi:hypothetical protein
MSVTEHSAAAREKDWIAKYPYTHPRYVQSKKEKPHLNHRHDPLVKVQLEKLTRHQLVPEEPALDGVPPWRLWGVKKIRKRCEG